MTLTLLSAFRTSGACALTSSSSLGLRLVGVTLATTVRTELMDRREVGGVVGAEVGAVPFGPRDDVVDGRRVRMSADVTDAGVGVEYAALLVRVEVSTLRLPGGGPCHQCLCPRPSVSPGAWPGRAPVARLCRLEQRPLTMAGDTYLESWVTQRSKSPGTFHWIFAAPSPWAQ